MWNDECWLSIGHSLLLLLLPLLLLLLLLAVAVVVLRNVLRAARLALGVGTQRCGCGGGGVKHVCCVFDYKFD
jgi:hypothetical protein